MAFYDGERAIRVISGLAFVLALTAWGLVSEVILPADKLGGWGRVTLLVLSALGVYELSFQLFRWALETRILRRLIDRPKLSGVWHQVFTIDKDRHTYRFGKVLMVADAGGIVISGENYRPDGTFSSHWQSWAVVVDGQRLHVFFTSTGLSRGTTTGTMSFLMVGNQPEVIIGTFSDSTPGTASGEIRLYRDEERSKEFRQGLQQSPTDGN